MKTKRYDDYVVSVLAVVLGLFVSACASAAEYADYPSRPIRLITPAAPGGTTDQIRPPRRPVASNTATDGLPPFPDPRATGEPGPGVPVSSR